MSDYLFQRFVYTLLELMKIQNLSILIILTFTIAKLKKTLLFFHISYDKLGRSLLVLLAIVLSVLLSYDKLGRSLLVLFGHCIVCPSFL